MLNRTLWIAIAAVLAIAVGFALSFFELILLGVLGAIVAAVLAVKGRTAGGTPGR
jgi:uncharacterized membrane protein YccC